MTTVTIQSDVRMGAYYDSVILMQVQKRLAALPGIVDAGVVMATPANKALLAAGGLLPPEVMAEAHDLLIVVKGETETAATQALAQLDAFLQPSRSQTGQTFRPRSLEAAVKTLPGADWVLISVPGRYAAGVAEEALRLNKHVFLYSDNVPLEAEVQLKQTAREKGLLVMGPDCGTAIINSVGLGFANHVRPGNIGLVGASGTGLQAVTAEIHNLGGGISQAIGTGGRDLKAAVGGITAYQALMLLKDDLATQVIVLISKPPAPAVATRLLQAAQTIDKPIVINFIGYPPPGRQIGNLYFAVGLSDAAELAMQLSNLGSSDISYRRRPFSGYVRGLFSGGTLAYETLLGLQTFLSPLYSNVPFSPEQTLSDAYQSQSHTIVDMGEDDFTQGRLHPMMDQDLRLRRLRQEAANPEVGFILLDVVLGEGAHSDPAAELAPVIAEVRAARADTEHPLKVIAIVVGTEADPQGLDSQIERLIAAGAVVFPNTAEAVDYIFNRLPDASYEEPSVAVELLTRPFAAINVGLESFYHSLTAQLASAIHVDWRPPAGGNEKLMAILTKMKGS